MQSSEYTKHLELYTFKGGVAWCDYSSVMTDCVCVCECVYVWVCIKASQSSPLLAALPLPVVSYPRSTATRKQRVLLLAHGQPNVASQHLCHSPHLVPHVGMGHKQKNGGVRYNQMRERPHSPNCDYSILL